MGLEWVRPVPFAVPMCEEWSFNFFNIFRGHLPWASASSAPVRSYIDENLHITKWVRLFVCFQLLGKCHFGAPGPWLAPPLSKAILMNNLYMTKRVRLFVYFPLLGKCHSKNQ